MESTAQEETSDTMDAPNPPPSQDDLLLALLGVTSSAPSFAFGYLTVRDRLQLLLLSKTIKNNLRTVEYNRCKDGRLYQIPFPGFPGLLDQKGEGLFPHQLASLQALHRAENQSTEFGALRGGILADAPGLGKTITMLSLIASTAGKRPRAPPEFWNPQQMQEGWQALTQNPGCETDIYKVLKPFRGLKIYQELARQVRPPFCPTKFPTIQHFERYIIQTVKANGATDMELDIFRQNLLQLKAGLHKSHRKVLMSEAGKRQAWERSLIPASATLLIVPDALLEHWFQQIHQHLNRALFTERFGRGVVYLDGVGDIADARMPLGEVTANNKQPLLKPWELAKYMIVVTTFSRCTQEYGKEVELGNLGCGGKAVANPKKRGASKSRRRGSEDEDTTTGAFQSSLLVVRWLRIVVDEGHELGTYEGGNALTRFINQIAAERRVVLSGTPTTGDEDDVDFTAKALDQLQRLLVFLRHPTYGSMPSTSDIAPLSMYVNGVNERARQSRKDQKQQAMDAWVERVKMPFLQKKPEGREKLLSVLRSVAVLHRKEDINLPKPIFSNIEVDVPLPEQVQANMQGTPKNSLHILESYLHSNEFQELVDKAQAKHILQAIQKAKGDLQLRGGPLEVSNHGAMQMLSAEDVNDRSQDRRAIKAVVYSSNKNNLRDVTEWLYEDLSFENIAEAYDNPKFDCGSELSRFRHNRKEIRRCPVCAYQNDFEGTAKEKRKSPKCQNFLMEVVKRDDESVRFLVETERVTRAVPVNQGGNVVETRLESGLGHSGYRKDRKAWRRDDILDVNIVDPHAVLKKRESMEKWKKHGAEECMELAEEDQYYGKDWFFGPLPDRENGALTTEVVLKKWQKCGRFHNHTRWYEGPTLADVPLEPIRENTFILSLDAGLATGLDLSFVTHIFLLEPVDDAALLEQITSRAHRLGATGPVIVETVNPYYKLDPPTEAAVKVAQEFQQRANTAKKEQSSSKMAIQGRKKTALTKVVCQYCYRQFDSMEKAVAHENKQCARNPMNADVVDPWHISSVYREIRPPPPHTTTVVQQR